MSHDPSEIIMRIRFDAQTFHIINVENSCVDKYFCENSNTCFENSFMNRTLKNSIYLQLFLVNIKIFTVTYDQFNALIKKKSVLVIIISMISILQ